MATGLHKVKQHPEEKIRRRKRSRTAGYDTAAVVQRADQRRRERELEKRKGKGEKEKRKKRG